jgi:capsular exopolysaccharide synthesis family protein
LILGGVASATAWMAYNPTRFKATSLVEVQSRAPIIDPTSRELMGDTARPADYLATQVTLLKSRNVLNKAIGYNGIGQLPTIVTQADPIAWLAANLEVKFSGEVMKISLQGDRDNDVVSIVNAVTDAYIKEVRDKERLDRQEKAKLLGEQIVKEERRIDERKDAYRDLATVAGGINLASLAFKQQLMMQEMSNVRQQVQSYDSELHEAQVQISLLTGQPLPFESSPDTPPTAPATSPDDPATTPTPEALNAANMPTPEALNAAIESSPSVVAAKEQCIRLQNNRRRQHDAARGAGLDPAVRRAETEYQAAYQALNAARQAARNNILASIQNRGGKVGGQSLSGNNAVAVLNRKIKILEAFKGQTQTEFEKIKKDIEDLNADAIEIQENQEDIDRLEYNLKRLKTQHDRFLLELNSEDRVASIENATRAEMLSSKKKYIIVAGAGAGTLCMVLLGFAWFDARNRRVGQVGDVAKGLGMEVVGTLPALPTARIRRAGTANWENHLMESVDATRAVLLHAARTDHIQVVMITSAIKGEGKTSLASHLATSLARARRRTLLVDGDLRSPMLHKLFDMPRTPGLAEFLRDESDLADVLQATPAPNLTLVTAGMVDPESLSALAEGRIQLLLEATRGQYDFILIDTPPILPVSDALQISQHVDAAIFSVLRDVSRLPKIHEAYSRLANLGVRTLGTVVAGTTSYNDPSYAYPYAGTQS